MGFGIGPWELIMLAACPLTLAMAMSNKRRATGNLVNCPDCGNGVTTRAPACPHCGRPMSS
jgi:predicted amidophosphoribosyltransferase